jgi:putative membrane protein
VLAIDRIRLANERTLLAWLRTAIMLLRSGVTLLKLFAGILVMEVTGATLIPAGFLTAGLGVRRYLRTRTLIEAADKD